MLFRVICSVVLASSYLTCDVSAGDSPTSHTVCQKLESHPEFSITGLDKKQRLNIDSVVATTPPVIAGAVNAWTGIADRGKSIKVKFFHIPAASRFPAWSHGDGYSKFSSSTPPGEEESVTEDTHVRYREALVASDQESFFVLGLYEFDNQLMGRKCYVVCKVEGRKPASKDPEDGIIHPTGTATWIGPILNASSILFADDDSDEENHDEACPH
jgi:hypothetical protein